MALRRSVPCCRLSRVQTPYSVTLPLHCTTCFAALRLTYQPTAGEERHYSYDCPHCKNEVHIRLPGPIVSLFKAGETA